MQIFEQVFVSRDEDSVSLICLKKGRWSSLRVNVATGKIYPDGGTLGAWETMYHIGCAVYEKFPSLAHLLP